VKGWCVAIYVYFSAHPKKSVFDTLTSTILFPTFITYLSLLEKKKALHVFVCVRERPSERKRRERKRIIKYKTEQKSGRSSEREQAR